MFTLAHLSDIHLPPLPRPRIHELTSKRILGYINWQRRRRFHRRDILDALVADLHMCETDHIAITGDITNIGLPEEFRLASEWLKTLGSPDMVTVVPGNHDAYMPLVRNPGFWHWETYMSANEAGAAFLGNSTERSFPFLRLFGDIALIGLSTAVPTLPGMATGRLGKTQLRALDALLDRLGRTRICRVVLIHHPPLPGMATWGRALSDAFSLNEVLQARGAELVIYGHNHRFLSTTLETPHGALPIIGVPAASIDTRHAEKRARYNLFDIAKRNTGRWEITLRRRRLNGAGNIEETSHGVLGRE
jgi:3',5'-cyclic AMP phosphodiesterase CpdA